MSKIKYLFSAVSIIFLLVLSAITYIHLSSTNSRNGTLQLVGLNGPVEINWDQWGIPHINAQKDDKDAFFALGYVHAQDRFWQMEFQRRIVQGTLSEVLGPATLDKDKFLRTWGFYRAAQTAYASLDDQTKQYVHSYTQGVNAFLQHGNLPLEFKILRYQPQPWTDVDSISWGKMMAFDLQDAWQRKIINYQITQRLGADQIPVLLPPYPANAPTQLSEQDLQQNNLLNKSLPDPRAHNNGALNNELTAIFQQMQSLRLAFDLQDNSGIGSNAWALSGRLTNTGKPLLVSDPHLVLQEPNIWYLAELRGPHLHVVGATIPGTPNVLVGHNDAIAWGVTNVNPDVQELYFEPINAKFTLRHEKILVHGEAPVDLIVRETEHGPIISDVVDTAKKFPYPLALKWTALLPGDTTAASFFKINYAQNWQQFTDALQTYVVPSQNFVYADRDNNIGYYMSGKIPVRSQSNNGLPILPTQSVEWTGYIPFEKMPHVLNPPEGMIISANNKAVPDNYLYDITFRWEEPPYRAQRISDLLHARPQYSFSDMQTIQLDNISTLWLTLKSQLLQTKPLNGASKQALQLLQNWDGATDVDNKAATVFAFWFQQLNHMPNSKLNFLPSWSQPLFIQQQLQINGEYCREKNNDCLNFQSKTLQLAMQNLAAQLGNNSENWSWQKVHHAEFQNVTFGKVDYLSWLWKRSIATAGGLYTVNVANYPQQNFTQIRGASYRQIIDLNNVAQSIYVQALGQSENIFDPHYADQMPLWRDGKYLPMDVAASQMTEKLVLQPMR